MEDDSLAQLHTTQTRWERTPQWTKTNFCGQGRERRREDYV